ncbi:MAG: DUF4156 domain-containing protein [Halopseudomonas sp.]
MKKTLTLVSAILLSGCSALSVNQVQPEAESVRLYDDYEQVKQCRYIKEVIGSEGRWYTFLFTSNKNLTLGALNDIKNQTQALGGNAIHTHPNMLFGTSVTILGQAYEC